MFKKMLKGRNGRVVFSVLIFICALGFILANSNYQFQFEIIPAGSWETVDNFDSEDLSTYDFWNNETDSIEIPDMQSQFVTSATTWLNYVDATTSLTYGTLTSEPPDGMGNSSLDYQTGLIEESYIDYSYTTKTSYTGGSMPTGWTGWQVTWDTNEVKGPAGKDYASGTIGYTTQYDMTSYDATRVRWSWKNVGGDNTEYGDMDLNYYAGGGYSSPWASPAGYQSSYTSESYVGSASSDVKVRWSISGMSGDAESWEQFYVDNIYLEGRTDTPGYRFQAVFQFQNVYYTNGVTELHIVMSALSGDDDLDFRIGTTATPTQLVADDKQDDFIVDVNDYVQGSTVYLDIRDDYRDGDPSQTTAYIQRCYLRTVNTAPVNDQTPVCTNLDDTDYLYAEYRVYNFSTSVTDVEGKGFIRVELSCVDGTTPIWTIRFDAIYETFEVTVGSDLIESTGGVFLEAGTNLDVWFHVRIDWSHPDVSNYDLKQYCMDYHSATATDYYTSIDYNYETRLNWSSVPIIIDDDAGTVDRGDLDEAFTMEGTLKYYGSTLVPSDDEVDVWVSCTEYGTNVGPWSDLLGSSGTYTVTCYADDTVGLDAYIMKPVGNDTGSGEPTSYYTTDLNDTYIADRIQILTTVATDGRINYGVDTTTINVTAQLEYTTGGVHSLGSGDTLYMNDTSMTWNADHFYIITGSYSIIDVINYFVNSSSASEATHGITGINLDGNDANVIWDRINITATVSTDGRIDYGSYTTINVTASLEYDGHVLGSGDTLYMNDTSMTWDTDHYYITAGSYNIVDIINYFVNSTDANEATYGITNVHLDSNSANVIWDRVIWNMYTRNATVDGRLTNCTSVNIGEIVNITARFLFEYDSTTVTTGTIYLEGESMTYIANGFWYLLVSNATAQFGRSYQWNSFTTTGNDYGITVENANSKDFYIIWDSIYISTHGVEPDARHNMGEYPTLWVTAKLTYDDDVLDTTSDYIKLADQTFQWNGSYLVNNTFTLWQVGQFTLETNDTGHNEATYGITEIEYYSFTTIFDRVLIYAMWSPTEADNRTNYGDTETVYVSFVSEYDNSSMTAGAFELNSTGMSYVSGSIWQKIGYAYSEVANYTFNVTSASSSAYGINQINYNDWNVTYYYIIWDRVKILTTVTDDGRITYDTNATLSVTAELEYDSHALGSGDTLYLNNTVMSWNGTHFVSLNQKLDLVGLWNYYVNTSGVSEASYGITYLNLDSNDVDQIWDRVYITSIHVSDSRSTYGVDANVTVTAKSKYNDDVLGSGDSIYINGTLATWDSTHSVFNVTYAYSEVANKTFHVTAATEATYGITAFTNDTYIWIVWDRLKITEFEVDNVLPDPLQMVFVNLTIVYEYDSAEFHFDNGTITMIAYNVTWDVEEEKNMHWNDTNWQFNHTMPSGVGVVRNFNISAYTDSVYGIAVINWNGFDNVTAGSDRVIVVSYAVSDDRDDINDYIWVNVTLQLESNGTAIVDGDVVVNGYIFTHISGGDWRYNTTQASVTSIDFDSVVAENNTYGIETVNQNGQYTIIIWDRIVITNFWVIDNRTDINTAVQIRLTAELDYDDTELGSGDTIYINSTLATWDAVNLRFYISENYGTALNYTYGLTSITEIYYTITEVTNTSYIWQIWDQFVLTRFNSSDADGRTNLDETEYIHFGMKWDYDNEVFQSGNGTIYLNSTLMTWNASQNCWTFSWVNSTSVSYLFAYASHTDNVYGITEIDWGAYNNVTQTWDRISVTVATNLTWTIIGYNVMVSYTSIYESDGVTWGGNATIANTSMVSGSRPRNENLTFTTVGNYTFYTTAISLETDDITGFITNTVWCVWDNITATAMYGSEVIGVSKIFQVVFGDLQWQFNGSGVGIDWICYNIRNGTAQSSSTTLADSYLEPLLQEVPIPLAWEAILYSNNATKTINGRAYDFQWYSVVQIVMAETHDCHIVILNNLILPIPFDVFEVYQNDSRVYHNIIQVTDGYTYNITVKNRFGDTVNETIFDADYEMIVFVNTYSFKFMNWYNGFLRVNVTRGGQTYSEIIMPMEIIEFNLFEETYTFSVDFLNGTTKFEQEITVTNSTGYVITGDTLSDVFSLVDNVYEMTNAINVTITTTNDTVITILIDIENMNTTIWDQTVNIITNIENSNTTIYDQTVTLISQLLNLNSTVYDQTVTMLSNIINLNTTIFDQTIIMISNIENLNSTVYDQTVSMLSNISNLNSTILAQTVTILSDISNVNLTLYTQTVAVLSNITNVNSTIFSQTVDIISYVWNNANSIYNQTVDILSDIQNTNTTIYTQTVTVLSQITNMNSTIYSQTVDILNYIWNNATSIYNQTVTMLSDISNVNTTLYSQTVTLLSNIENMNSTIYTQTVQMLSDISNMNTTLYSQVVTILSDISNINTTLCAQTVSILSNIENVNSTIYAQTVDIISYVWNNANSIYNQTVTVLSDIQNLNSTIYAQTVLVLSNITNMNSTIYTQTVQILSDIQNVNSTLYTQTLSILSEIINVNSTIYAQTVSILSSISNVNTTLYTQTLTILSNISNVNSTLYAQTVTALNNIQNMNATIYQQTIDILTSITNINSTIYSQVLTAISNLAELNATIYLVDDPTNLNLLIAGYAFSDDYCDFTIVSNWHNSSLSVYENDVLKEGPVSELLGLVRYTLNDTIGSYNLSVYIDAGVDSLWYNVSYVVEGMEYGQVNVYNSRGTGFDDTHFIVYINGSRYFDNRFYNRSDWVYNITVTDYFGYVVSQDNYDWARMIDVGIDFYVYKVKSELQGQAAYFNLTRTGGAKFSQHLLAGEIVSYYLAAGEYTYEFRKVTSLGGSTYVYYGGTFTLSTDKTHIIDGTNLRDIENDIELIPAGKTDIKPLETAMSGVMSMISMMQLGMWGLAFLIIVGMAATATEEEVMKDGTKVKKRKIPKQLKRFAFGKGAKNPKSKAIPKGAGRSAWKGVPFKDKIKDWRENM